MSGIRLATAIINGVLALFMTGVFTIAGAFYEANRWFLVAMLLVPMAIAVWSLVPIDGHTRAIGYMVLILCMLPLTYMGFPGGWGWLYASATVITMFAAIQSWQK